jgi:endonuclease I
MQKSSPFRWSILLFLLLSGCVFNAPSSNGSSDHSSTSQISSSESESISSSESSLISSSSESESSSSSSSEERYFYDGYYASLQGKVDGQIFLSLRSLLRQALTTDGTYLAERLPTDYGHARYILDDADRDPNNPNNVILVYSQTSVSGVWDGGSTWNREHVWPQSLMSPNLNTNNDSRHKGADLQNLKPANPSDNSSRGNKYYGETATSKTYLPPANVRGDLARILFYMTTMYPELTLVNVNEGADVVTYQMAQLNVLVKWHELDPVDAFEMNRNDVIYSYQNNRNPYIDHPELVCRVWQNATPTITSLCS